MLTLITIRSESLKFYKRLFFKLKLNLNIRHVLIENDETFDLKIIRLAHLGNNISTKKNLIK